MEDIHCIFKISIFYFHDLIIENGFTKRFTFLVSEYSTDTLNTQLFIPNYITDLATTTRKKNVKLVFSFPFPFESGLVLHSVTNCQ